LQLSPALLRHAVNFTLQKLIDRHCMVLWL